MFCADRATLCFSLSAALLFVLAFFVKHNLVVLPLAVTVWLALYDRRSALTFAGAGTALGVAGMILFRIAYGFDLFAALHSARVFAVHDLIANLSSWLVWGLLPLSVAGLLIARRRDDKFVVLIALYAAIGFVVGASYFGGAGVDVNAMFDADIALALVAGLALNRLSDRGVVVGSADCRSLSAAARRRHLVEFRMRLAGRGLLVSAPARRNRARESDTGFLRAHKGPRCAKLSAIASGLERRRKWTCSTPGSNSPRGPAATMG